MRIREIREDDWDAIKEISDIQLGEDYLGEWEEEIAEDEVGVRLCVEVDGKIVAFATLWTPDSKDVAILHTNCVHPDHVRKGIGSALVKERLKIAKSMGYETALAHAWNSSRGCNACRMLEKHGFEQQCELLNFYQDIEGHCPTCPGICICSALVYTKKL
jgi:ribosomal protein S18 acetylase RimI-like enzyme